jgi:hypothetical protein
MQVDENDDTVTAKSTDVDIEMDVDEASQVSY